MNSTQENLNYQIQQKLKQSRRKRLPKVPPLLTTQFLERRYFAQLKALTDTLKRLTKELLLPEIENILQEAKELRPKQDAIRRDRYADKVVLIMKQLRAQFLVEYPEAELQYMAIEAAKNIEHFNSRQIDRIFRAVFGNEYSRFEPWLTEELKAFVAENVSLLSSLSEDYFKKVEGIVLRSAQSGRLAADIAQDLRKQFGIVERRAALIARDQVSSFNGNLTQLRQTNAGIVKYRWQTSGDDRVRDSHEDRDGKVFEWKEAPEGGHPGQDILCRCVAVPVFEN